MAFISPNFDNIKVIICSNGFKIDCEFILREIGFCYNNVSSSIPFNNRMNRSKLDVTNQFIIDYMENESHGIKFNKKFEYGMTASEYIPVLKSIYHLNQTTSAKYIGICKSDDGLKGLLFKAGFGHLIIELEDLEIFKNSGKILPTDGELMVIQQKDLNIEPCRLHDRLNSSYKPFCAKNKAEYLFSYCKSLFENKSDDQNQINFA